jgi:hypothetical protein
MHRVTSIVDAAPYRLFRSRRSPAHSGTAATRSRRAAECPYHPAGGDVQPVARRVRGSRGGRRSGPRRGSAGPRPTRWLVGGGKKAGREGGGASGHGSSHAGWSVGAPAPAGSTPPRQPPGRPHRPSPGLPSIARGVTRARAAASRGWPAAPAGAHGPIEPRSSCKSSRPSRGRRHRRRGTSRTDGDTQARRPRDLAYLWHSSMAGQGPGPDRAKPPHAARRPVAG